MKNRCVLGLFLLVMVALVSLAAPQASQAGMQGVYQVFVVDAEGTPASAPVSVTVGFYDAETGGSPYWSETQTVTPASGLCIVNLGAVNPFNLSFDIPYYLAVQVGGLAESTARLAVQGPGSYSQAGADGNAQSLNVKYEWLDINVQ